MATILGTGGSLVRALEMLRRESGNRVMRRTLDRIRKHLDEGSALSLSFILPWLERVSMAKPNTHGDLIIREVSVLYVTCGFSDY